MWFDLHVSRDFWGVFKKNPKIRGSALVSRRSSANKIQRNLFCGSIAKLFIPREARPKASRSGVYNFVPQRAQAG